MESKKTVSVVVPVYNVEKYLRRCVDSIIAQTYAPLEIILVDDGSPDSSGAICDEYAAKYDNIRVIHKTNGGLSSARKAGWEVARGELIAFVDSDDYVTHDYVSKLTEPFSDSAVQLSICGYSTQKGEDVIPAELPYSQRFIENGEVGSMYILPIVGAIPKQEKINIPAFVPIRMYKRKLLEKGDFVSEREYFTEDVIMNILYGRRISGKIAVVNEPLYYYCVNPGSLTLKYRENAFNMLMKCYNLCEKLASDLGVNPYEVSQRLDANLTAATTYSIYNIGTIRDYHRFKSELHTIFSHPNVKELFKNGNWPKVATWHKIIYAAYLTKAFFILYKLLKTRKVL